MNDNQLKTLYINITKNRGKPLDFWEIAALLEVYGIRDIDAQNEYGFDDVFAMARYLEKFKDQIKYATKNKKDEKEPILAVRIVQNYIKGLAFAMPMLVQILFTLIIGYAIWSGMDMDRTKATVIALGTFLALLITGGVAQAIGRKGLFYLKQKEYILASLVTRKLLKVAVGIMIIVGIFFIALNMFFEILPTYYFYVLITFYFLLSILFFNISVFQMFEEYYTILLFFVIGIIFVYIFHTMEGIALPEAQFLALVALNTILSIYTWYRLKKLKKLSVGEGELVPRNSVMFYTLMPFYIYGFLYFSLLIADKVIAWSVIKEAMPYFIWFDVPYELGTDWALLILILLMGLAEVSIYEFIYRINENIKKIDYRDYKVFNQMLKDFYMKFNYIYVIFAVFTIFFVYIVVYEIYIHYGFGNLEDFFKVPTPYIYWFAGISYIFLVHALINVLFIFAFSRQLFAVKSIGIAIMIDVVVGLILSRTLGLEYAVVGLLVGSVFFWYYSFRYIMKMFKNLEFYYYSAI